MGTASGLRASFNQFHGQPGCLPARAIGRTDRLRRFTVCLCLEFDTRFGCQPLGGVRGQQRLMSGHDEAIAGPRKFCPAKSCSSVGPPGESPPRQDKNLLRKMKMGPLRVGAWPNDAQKDGSPPGRCVAEYASRRVESKAKNLVRKMKMVPLTVGAWSEARSTLVCRNVKYRSTADIALYADLYQWAFR